MRAREVAVLVAFVVGSGCGYVGPVVPPSTQIPLSVTDLTIAEQGDHLVIQFTTPTHTTDGVGVKEFTEIDLRIGASETPFDADRWAKSATKVEVEPPEDIQTEAGVQPVTVIKDVPIATWEGKKITVAVRTSARRQDHYSAWSNPVSFEVQPALLEPKTTITATAGGYRLTWDHPQPGVEYRVFRQAAGEKTPTQVGSTSEASFTDSSAHWETPYVYSVVAAKGPAESAPWVAAAPVNAPDTFPPSVPSELTASASADFVQLSWQRSPESDLAGYFVYRATGDGAWQKQRALVNVPTYADRAVQHGARYRYAVSAVDAKGNESEKSAPVEVAFP